MGRNGIRTVTAIDAYRSHREKKERKIESQGRGQTNQQNPTTHFKMPAETVRVSFPHPQNSNNSNNNNKHKNKKARIKVGKTHTDTFSKVCISPLHKIV
jgi:hypothetical protein